jgi:FKBP-type peptidyl-prolyl cis-trans isomerase SlyD
MKIENNTVVSLTYKLTNHKTGETIEETTTENPMLFLYGVGAIIPEFEQNLNGKITGDKFNFAITSDNAYGDRSEEQVALLPKSIFHDENGVFNDEQIAVGAVLPMSDNEGNHLNGIVVAVDDENVTMDFNHPLSGVDLHFDGEILEVRRPTEEEIKHGHAHGPNGHEH